MFSQMQASQRRRSNTPHGLCGLPPEILRQIAKWVQLLDTEQKTEKLKVFELEDSNSDEEEDEQEKNNPVLKQFMDQLRTRSKEMDKPVEFKIASILADMKKKGEPRSAVAKFEKSIKRKRMENGDEHKWEELGKHKNSSLEAMSRTNRALCEVVEPFLWETVSLKRCSNTDLLYLHQVILPRHAQYIRSLRHIDPSQTSARTRIPAYITSTLSIPPDVNGYGFTSKSNDTEYPESERVDMKVLKEKLWPSLQAVRSVVKMEDRNEEHQFIMGVKEAIVGQRKNLIEMLLGNLPNLERVGVLWDGGDRRVIPHFKALSLFFEGDLGERIKEVSINDSACRWPLDVMMDQGLRPVYNTSPEETVASFLTLLPNLTKVTIRINFQVLPIGDKTNSSTTTFAAVLSEMENLEELDICWQGGLKSSFFEVGGEWSDDGEDEAEVTEEGAEDQQTGDEDGEDDSQEEEDGQPLWKCPLRKLRLAEPLRMPPENLGSFFTQFATLESLEVVPARYHNGKHLEEIDPSYPIESIHLSKLTHLAFPVDIYPIQLYNLFDDSPLEEIRFDYPVAFSNLKSILEKHESTLKKVLVKKEDKDDGFGGAEVLEIQLWAKEKGVTVVYDGVDLKQDEK